MCFKKISINLLFSVLIVSNGSLYPSWFSSMLNLFSDLSFKDKPFLTLEKYDELKAAVQNHDAVKIQQIAEAYNVDRFAAEPITPFFKAMQTQDLELMQEIAKYAQNLNFSFGRPTALELASEQGDVEAVKILVQQIPTGKVNISACSLRPPISQAQIHKERAIRDNEGPAIVAHYTEIIAILAAAGGITGTPTTMSIIQEETIDKPYPLEFDDIPYQTGDCAPSLRNFYEISRNQGPEIDQRLEGDNDEIKKLMSGAFI